MQKRNNLKLRKATKSDCYDLWIWRNHPEIRKQCFNPEKTGYATHKRWFKEKIRDKKANIYIAENTKGEKIGQVRFEKRTSRSTYINTNLNPDFFGKGFGSKIIRQSSENFLKKKKKNNHLKEIIAEVFDVNIASRKVFQKAGYEFFHNAIKNGKKIIVYKFKK